ncbi:hypothetical protein G5V58_05125 [Nocardioides anomalus]|uniref:Uncharacterized protein n=1 Tax=Nocardioides anomalus TaxID=2712223 RepID=A0A6G6WA61_9ACTN|nr:hypothetical protein [Nocardioides anomalus]QIG42228.1 hypothetical protein G5V58_05125 [Nocardioides anomalus]
MSEPPPTHEEQGPSIAGEVARGLGSVAEDWGRDTLVGAAVLVSVISCLSGFADGGVGWILLGFAVGLPGLVLPFVSQARWSRPTTWLVALACLVASLAVVIAAAARA